jgi:hypothetical protein
MRYKIGDKVKAGKKTFICVGMGTAQKKVKKILALLVMAMFVCGIVFADTESWKPGKVIEHNYIASQTGQGIVTATTSCNAIVTDIVISATGTGTVYLFDESDQPAYRMTPVLSLAANGSYVSNLKGPFVTSGKSHIIKYTSGSGAAGSIWIHYIEE